ncbi:metal-dependent hydrolase [Candidatus Woesearchaeota archaeon]|nr:metal-dependent hydrolase [Candidatus Woesearchaeota archaeon]
MFFLTHLFSALFFYFLFFDFSLIGLFFVSVGSLFPDVDYAGSILGRYFKPVEFVFGHRKFFHSIVGLVFFSACLYYFFGTIALFFSFGFFIHLFFDSLNFSGIRWFYPLKIKVKGVVRAGGFLDIVFSIVFFIGIIFLLFL